ncbi:hypothetical protein E1286_05300 [Nonomuraea terrae]|uniref:Uncharacterized protein n=1 Tax=Nonomuraea terrae TaxID=2530383 RepID=A0A4R4Z9E6_9ACTN|nr:hypothetical protein [Nonomuraea terrae]TDD54606.1 hypothetical protein E1286_05300 [Nonomuraea terrae]
MLVVAGLATSAHAATGWVANSPSKILNSNTVRLVGGNTSVETANLDMFVQAGDVVSFRYVLQGDAKCDGGAPRVYVEAQGVVTNSWDQNLAAGTQCGSNGVVTFKVPANGRIGAAGVVYDNGKPGQVVVSDLRVDGRPVSFLNRPLARVTPDAPKVVQPECGTSRGTLTVPAKHGVTYQVNGEAWRPGEYKVRPGVYRVAAEARDGYRLVGDERWRLTVDKAAACPSPSPTPTEPPVSPSPTTSPTDTPEVREATPAAPVLTQATCDDKTASIAIPEVAGVVYKTASGKTVEQGKRYTVEAGNVSLTAEAADGYTLKDGAAAEWMFVVSETPDCQTPSATPTTPVVVVNNIPVPARVDTGLGGLTR